MWRDLHKFQPIPLDHTQTCARTSKQCWGITFLMFLSAWIACCIYVSMMIFCWTTKVYFALYSDKLSQPELPHLLWPWLIWSREVSGQIYREWFRTVGWLSTLWRYPYKVVRPSATSNPVRIHMYKHFSSHWHRVTCRFWKMSPTFVHSMYIVSLSLIACQSVWIECNEHVCMQSFHCLYPGVCEWV